MTAKVGFAPSGPCRAAAVVSMAAAMLLAGCASGPKTAPLYQWSNVPEVLYQDLTRAQTTQEQLNALQKYVSALQAANQPVPPGLRMHMALLHQREGRIDVATQLLKEEAQHYPGLAGFAGWVHQSVQPQQAQAKTEGGQP